MDTRVVIYDVEHILVMPPEKVDDHWIQQIVIKQTHSEKLIVLHLLNQPTQGAS